MMPYDGSSFFNSIVLIFSHVDYSTTCCSNIVIITVGARGSDEDKETAAIRNTEIFKEIIPEVVARSPECILIIVSHPGWLKFLLQYITSLNLSFLSFAFQKKMETKSCSADMK